MKKLSTNEIREIWINYFKDHDHHIEPSKSLVPVNDNSLLFINSGVATLKNYFSGVETPVSNKIANAQKSIRTNDIENVGLTSRHHTLFEMLGNFSIGEYFKEESIEMAYDILTNEKHFGFDVNKLYFTIHPDDNTTYEKWISLGIDPCKIIKLKENFWEIGKGPGGPNTEIFFDRGESYDSRDVVKLLKDDLENDRIIEIWNIVFSQYNCDPDNLKISQYPELPQKNIDTGMGLERMACVIQDVESNFETDNFIAIINNLVSITNIKYEERKMAYRVISDHIRALCFSIADGILPSNEGRGYVIRRILRRAVRYGYMDLNLNKPFLSDLVDTVVDVMTPFYNYLLDEKDYIKKVIILEEEKFFKTLSSGLKLINQEIANSGSSVLNSEIAFKLYDTYGFPIELTIEVVMENNIQVDIEGFDRCLKKQQDRARSAKTNVDAIGHQNLFLKTIDVNSKFIGYDNLVSKSKIVCITDLEQSFDQIANKICYLIFDITPFYANGGGQANDRGTINGFDIVEIVKLPNGQFAHKVNIESAFIGQEMLLEVDEEYREKITKNHSATHLLHLALHKIVGSHAKQAGSLQDDNRTRFDFSSLNALSKEEIIKVNNYVNELIIKNSPVEISQMNIDDAKKIGANALFGEKYSGIVRVVKIGESIELCGGTHVNNSGDIQKFQIMLESGIGSGVRRIEAVCGENVDTYVSKLVNDFDSLVVDIKSNLLEAKVMSTASVSDLLSKMSIIYDTTIFQQKLRIYEELVQQIKDTKKEIQSKNSNDANKVINMILESKVKFEDTYKIEYEVENFDSKKLKYLADQVIKELKSCIIILKVIENSKVSIVVKVSADLTNKYHAGNIVHDIISPFNGRGGGKPDMAQGGYQL